MTTTHNLGYPRIGARRELKFALEALWHGKSSEEELQTTAAELRQQNWKQQAELSLAPVGDFSLYDQVLDMSATLGNLPERASTHEGSALDAYFRVARGRSPSDSACCSVHAGEMTKWFDTNYHYIVPEFSADTCFSLNADRILEQLAEARTQGLTAKPVIIGPVTYLWLGKARDESDSLGLLAGVHLDAISAPGEVSQLADWLPAHKVLSLGVINGRNIWKTDLNAALEWLEPLKEKLGDRLWLAPSCSLLHVPADLESETTLDSEISNWLAFSRQKLQELSILAKALDKGRAAVAQDLSANQKAIESRRLSSRVHNPAVAEALSVITLRRCSAKSNWRYTNKSVWDWTSWCTAKQNATTWSSTLANSWKVTHSAALAGCNPMARGA
jgi:hypothetical protein